MKRITQEIILKRFFIPLVCFFTYFSIIPVGTYAQSTYLQSFEKKLTPSPAVSALGNFGGLEVKKNTGGIQKSIKLFDIQEGDLNYSPSIEYFSTGIKVDDWGSRVGIGWTENITATISRTVKGRVDGGDRVGDGQYEMGDPNNPVYTQSLYDKVRTLASPTSTLDGEYDLFNFNIFGNSGQFIIKDHQAVLLKNNNEVKIDLIENSGYYFVVTDMRGIKYYFNGEIESTRFSNDNGCDIDNGYQAGGIVTAWFIAKIVSPGGNTINFNYTPAQYTYIYDYHESYLYYPMPQQTALCDAPPSNSRTYCIRRKTTNTQLLSSVTGDNFTLTYNYLTRNDIYNEKLLQTIVLQNNSTVIKGVTFNYDQINATSTFESALASSLDNDPVENNGLKTRYFLKTLTYGNGQSVAEQVYKFSYINPTVLPHRFSFAQDYLGIFNGKGNGGMIPVDALEGFIIGAPLGGMPNIPFANRQPQPVGNAGLLSAIIYPTGGRDSIVYEQNKYRAEIHHERTATRTDWLENDDSASWATGFDIFNVPINGPVNLKLECYYALSSAPTLPNEEYSADATLWSSDGQIRWPDGRQTIEFHLGTVFNSTTGNPPIKLNFEPGKDYWMSINLYGPHTSLKYTLTYIDSVYNTYQDSAFVGHRVKKVISSSGTSPDMIKSYNYNVFQKTGDMLIMTDSSSLVHAPMKNFRVGGLSDCAIQMPDDGIFNKPLDLFSLMTTSNDDDNNLYGGLPYAYKNVTEFVDNDANSFVASEYRVTPSDFGHEILSQSLSHAELFYPGRDNSAWNHGLELARYTGIKLNNNYRLDKENRWSYSNTSNDYYNYSASQLGNIWSISTDPAVNLTHYIIKSNVTYSHYTKLDSLTEIDYFRTNAGTHTLVSTTINRYNDTDKQVEEEQTTNSKGETLLKQTFRPNKMVSLGLDPNSIYQGMVSSHILPDITVINKKNDVQTGLVRTNYYQPFTGLYVPQSIETQQLSTDPVVTKLKYLRYDSWGNVLSLANDGGPAVNYLWSYKGKYPVAQITNVDYSAIENTLGATAIANFGQTYPIKSDVDGFIAPLFSTFPNAQISSFSYTPQIGMHSQTDAKGNSTYYIYDAFQRLESIYDQHSNLVKSFIYNFQQH